MKKSRATSLNVKILSPRGVQFEGKAVRVSAINKVGPFDILVDHANFFSLLDKGTITVNTGDEIREFLATHGLVTCSDNAVTLLLDIEAA